MSSKLSSILDKARQHLPIIAGLASILVMGIVCFVVLLFRRRNNLNKTSQNRQSMRNKLNQVSSMYQINSYPRQSFSGIETRIPVIKSYTTKPKAIFESELGEPTPPDSDSGYSLDKPPPKPQKKQTTGLFDFTKKPDQPLTPPSDEYQGKFNLPPLVFIFYLHPHQPLNPLNKLVKRYPSFNKGKNRPFVFNIPSRDILTPSDSPETSLRTSIVNQFSAPAKPLSQHPMYRTSMNMPSHADSSEDTPNPPVNQPISIGWN
ncbi:hypothetical protein AYI68_g2022 [Smittium mucronatum]|uniref:Uncharacterized protein n=1 Tax=Smittium mucronatum TaxID=133383 RepID=A0A1R0H3W3_9FUNG|nr:hypothetical protein AYI68_g2022 [Smittium mucronatum]